MVQCQRELAQQNRTLVYCNIVTPPRKSIHWGNDGGLVTAYSTQGVDQQTYPGEAAPNWAEEPQLAQHQRGPRGLWVWGDKRRFMEMMIFSLFYGRDDHRGSALSDYLESQTHRPR